jgi:C-methyltransferase
MLDDEKTNMNRRSDGSDRSDPSGGKAAAQEAEPVPPGRRIADLTKAHIAARCLHVVAELGVADALAPGRAATAAELAERTGLDADALDRILRLLAAHGIFAHAEQDGVAEGYAHNAASELLRGDHPESMRSYVRMHAMPVMWDAFTRLAETARMGRPARDWASLLAYFAEHAEESARFNEAMIGKSRAVVPAVVDAYDFAGFGVIADIGGGRGHLLEAILERAPAATGILFELSHVIADAADLAGPRLRLEAGDFLTDPLPAADAYVLMDLLHDWSDADATRILAAMRRAAPPHARVLIVETLRSKAPGPHSGKTLDVLMLATTGGRERSPEEFAALLADAGFALRRVGPTASQYSLLEAVVVAAPASSRRPA